MPREEGEDGGRDGIGDSRGAEDTPREEEDGGADGIGDSRGAEIPREEEDGGADGIGDSRGAEVIPREGEEDRGTDGDSRGAEPIPRDEEDRGADGDSRGAVTPVERVGDGAEPVDRGAVAVPPEYGAAERCDGAARGFTPRPVVDGAPARLSGTSPDRTPVDRPPVPMARGSVLRGTAGVVGSMSCRATRRGAGVVSARGGVAAGVRVSRRATAGLRAASVAPGRSAGAGFTVSRRDGAARPAVVGAGTGRPASGVVVRPSGDAVRVRRLFAAAAGTGVSLVRVRASPPTRPRNASAGFTAGRVFTAPASPVRGGILRDWRASVLARRTGRADPPAFAEGTFDRSLRNPAAGLAANWSRRRPASRARARLFRPSPFPAAAAGTPRMERWGA